MMNWTGGQLQRHHNRSGLLTKAQKQSFARARLQKGTVIPPPSPFRDFPDIAFKGSSTRNKDEDEEAETNGIQVTEEPASHETGGQSSHSDDLTEVKRQLLQEPDWAAMSATRPLELAFTSVEEGERFGKRRKLNDQDRKRMVAANNGSTFFERPKPSRRGRNLSSVIDTIEEDIQFEINGRPIAQSNDSSGMAMNSISSQSMLLDHEGSSIVDQDLGKENLTATWITNLFPRSQ
ncbi:hypothetical protein PCG10_008877 [Penicillium crustosum]|uniref:Uncharacterized protein n=2 Tax=Penicillium crustosum TaxID=36656 RepID=A0A9P5GU03_PENCR|nr:hypothetical protein PCG10_008877 [Penicillium crustosum]